jgi:hypothetical protein
VRVSSSNTTFSRMQPNLMALKMSGSFSCAAEAAEGQSRQAMGREGQVQAGGGRSREDERESRGTTLGARLLHDWVVILLPLPKTRTQHAGVLAAAAPP